MPLITIDCQINPAKNKIIMMGRNINSLCIFDTNFNNIIYKTIYGPCISLKRNIELSESEWKIYYGCSRVTNQYIFGLYLNQPEKDRRYHSGNEEIHIFDWNANPIMNLIIPENIMFFAVDEKINVYMD